MDYGEVLSNAWKTIWKHKILWLFGILAAIGAGSGSRYNFNGPGRGTNSNAGQYLNPDIGNQVGSYLQQNTLLMVGAVLLVILLVLVLVAVLLVLGTYGRIGLARGAWEADEGAPRLTFAGLFSQSGRYFWRILLLALLLFVVWGVLALAIGLPLSVFGALTFGIGLICCIPLICLLAIAGWVAQIVIRMAIIAIVGEDIGIFAGIQRGWDVVRSHLGESVVMGLILGVGAGILHFIIALPFVAAALPMAVLIFNQSESAVRTGVIATAALICLYTPVAIFLGGVIESYVGSAWTLTFRRLTGHSPAAPVVAEVAAH